MNLQSICIIIACIIYIQTDVVYGDCPDGRNTCEWLNWGGKFGSEWTACTRSCGGGTRSRTRGLCCREDAIARSWDDCLADCRKSNDDSDKSENCGDVCYNGGVIVRDSSEFYGRRCKCTPLFTGRCCSDRTCSWDNYYCWPGHCSNDVASRCYCALGFQKQTGSSETTCQLKSSNAPSIEQCDTRVTGPNGEMKRASSTSSSTACSDLADFYGNFQPMHLIYDLITQFVVTVDVSSYTKPNFIHESNFGVSDVSLRVEVQSIAGSNSHLMKHTIFTGAVGSTDVVSTKSDNSNLSLGTSPPQLSDGQWLCVIYEAYGGGYLKSVDLTQTNRVPSAPVPYKKTKATRRLCYRYDISPPEHCKLDNSCAYEPLQVSEVVTRASLLTARFPGWTDPIPSGGSTPHASGIESFQLTVHEVAASKDVLKVNTRVLHTEKVNSSVTSLTVNLTSDTPKLYAIYLEVKDVADNVRQTRRLVLFDNSSQIDVRPDRALFIESASLLANYTWQTNHNDICLNWTDHFYNRFYLDNPLFNPVESDPSGLINDVYEQQTGLLPVSGTPNVHGIVEFRTSWSLNAGAPSSESKVQNITNQHYCNNFNVTDGQTYTLNIRAVDIANNSYAENRTVHIDRSAPLISNVRLAKDSGHRWFFVHDRADTSNTKLYFEVMDPHSGISDIQWTIGTSDSGTDVVTGYIAINNTGQACPAISKCYCPDVGGECEYYQYSIPVSELMAADKDTGEHNITYFFTIKATNHAHLSNIEHLDFLVNGTRIMSEDEASPLRSASIAGIVLGVITGLAATALCIALVVRRYKKKNQTNPQTEEKENM